MRIGVFALSGPFDPDRFDAGARLLESWGHELVHAPGVGARTGYLAGDDAHRLAGFDALLSRTDLDLLMAARGGYGVHRVLHRMDWARLGPQAPTVLGFSDLTALHLSRWVHCGVRGWHGPVVTHLPQLEPDALARVRQRLASGREEVLLPAETVVVEGEARGVALGGNLALVSGLVGTPHLALPPNTILMLEDVGEAAYRLDRMLTQFELAGLHARVVGVGLGDFVSGTPDDRACMDTVVERVARWGVPCVAGLPFGHGTRNDIFPLGGSAVLDHNGVRFE